MTYNYYWIKYNIEVDPEENHRGYGQSPKEVVDRKMTFNETTYKKFIKIEKSKINDSPDLDKLFTDEIYRQDWSGKLDLYETTICLDEITIDIQEIYLVSN